MAASSNVTVRNLMLQAILDWNPDTNGTTMKMGAYTTDADGAMLTTTTATYGTPSSGAVDISSNVVLNILAGSSVGHLRIEKPFVGGVSNYIYKKDITPETFDYDGTITITSAEISIADAV